MITFKANYIDTCTVKKYTAPDTFTDTEVSLVKLNPKDCFDKDAVQRIKSDWKSHYCNYYYADFFDKKYDYMEDKRTFFALTTQKDGFDNLIPDRILSVAEISEFRKDMCTLDLLQTNPDYMHDNFERTIKGAGEAILKAIIKLFGNKPIYLEATLSATPLYEKHGFKYLYGNSMIRRV